MQSRRDWIRNPKIHMETKKSIRETIPNALNVITSKNGGRIFFERMLCEKEKLQGRTARRMRSRVSARKAPAPYRTMNFFFWFKRIRYNIIKLVTKMHVSTEPYDGSAILTPLPDFLPLFFYRSFYIINNLCFFCFCKICKKRRHIEMFWMF